MKNIAYAKGKKHLFPFWILLRLAWNKGWVMKKLNVVEPSSLIDLKNHIGNQKLIFSIKYFFAIPLSTEPGWWYLWQNLNSQVQAGSLFRPWKWLSRTNNPHRDIFIAVDSSSTGLLDRMRFGDLDWAQHQCCHVSSDSVFVAVAVLSVWPLASSVISNAPTSAQFHLFSLFTFIFVFCRLLLQL